MYDTLCIVLKKYFTRNNSLMWGTNWNVLFTKKGVTLGLMPMTSDVTGSCMPCDSLNLTVPVTNHFYRTEIKVSWAFKKVRILKKIMDVWKDIGRINDNRFFIFGRGYLFNSVGHQADVWEALCVNPQMCWSQMSQRDWLITWYEDISESSVRYDNLNDTGDIIESSWVKRADTWSGW